jgi:GAF domain-containing protein
MTGLDERDAVAWSGLEEALAESAERLQRLQRVSHALAGALTVSDVAAAAMEVLDAPAGTTARALWLVDSGADSMELVAESGMLPEARAQYARIPLDSTLPGAAAVRDLRTVISPSRDDAVERFPELRDAPQSGDGFIAVPLPVEQQAAGVLVFGYNGQLDDSEVGFLEAAAGHLAQSLARVGLSEALRQRAEEAADLARRATEAAGRERQRREELEFIAAVTQAAISSATHDELIQALATVAVPTLGDWCSVHFVPELGAAVQTVVVHADPTRQGWADRLAQQFPYDPTGERGVAFVLRTGRPDFMAEVPPEVTEAASTRFGDDTDRDTAPVLAVELDATSVITVPIATKRRVIGALQVVRSGASRAYDLDDVALAEGVAGRVADAIENTWLTEQHRFISVTLQQAFLPPALAIIPDLEVSSAYWPAGTASDVGGDFYDVFSIGNRRWALAIGDACGTGPNAAALTMIARHTTRAAARHDQEPHQVLEWVNEAVRLSDRDLFCTACYATISQPEGDGAGLVLRCVSGGHPLPIHRTSTGTKLLGRPGTLLGVFDTIRTVTEQIILEPGDTVVFYTDGVTDLPPPYGRTENDLARLIDDLPADLSADEVKDAIRADLVTRVPDPERHDDVALLVIRYTPSC